ncbi:putative HslV family peptidase protein [Rhizobium phage RHph_TM39]|uniref:Putative HslV family peptidase protein n=2 Tax=Cuauhnahuacvirus TaxID=3044696 RepID=A0A7S5RI63_9CAUD|nr:peptidase HslV family [Rhizobium phage RHph_TM30]YP_010671205.1 peptidase HslV family [Rhizobium phage RHph_Y65]QIG71529.1 putative HslV family peptidase protein [Rhizobium phage RHph_TM40]QIG71892.1 putative HslV family peptidase protein [Rhizobium phage RHph_TM2_3B]QIG72254.1 putative HslV family peptidase protein [Rhizobium phage RHph_TM3_3_6]QIG77046.1 putative HslV family peptidase protein [Rhizobium phage RHph_TM39]QIG77385.1 putative HslV family peptidase protein [Rhizobium phage RH
MTTVAYRNGILAADSLINVSGTRVGKIVKVRRINDYLVGFSGDVACSMRFIRGFELSEFKYPVPSDMTALIVDRKNRVMRVEGGEFFEFLRTDYDSIGSGFNFALGAMAHGANAVDAVKCAMKHDVYTGGRIMSISFKD